jgi:UDP-N-acetylglucosamine--N-acetylmuramyl-(pentapeptide) pyrophosphoryl-undecaprenol N-acetylglucosamine transferase
VPPKVTDRAHARAQLGIGEDETCVLVFGGSLGARSINHAAVEAFKDAPYRVVHVAGTRDYPDLTPPGDHYVLLDYLTPFGTALAAADAAVARSGGSVFELAQYGLPSVLIPYPHASADHQSANARWMADAGAARIVTDAELTPQRLRAETDAILGDRAAMSQAALRLAKPDAAKDIAHEILATVTGEKLHTSG